MSFETIDLRGTHTDDWEYKYNTCTYARLWVLRNVFCSGKTRVACDYELNVIIILIILLLIYYRIILRIPAGHGQKTTVPVARPSHIFSPGGEKIRTEPVVVTYTYFRSYSYMYIHTYIIIYKRARVFMRLIDSNVQNE